MNLYWTITETCQLRCRYCYYEVGTCKRNKENLDIDLFRSCIRDISNHVESITFTGGEVLLLPYFWEIVEIARNHNVQVNFLTDGIRFDKQNLEQALALGVSGVSVSLDSLDNTINEWQRPPKVKTRSSITEVIKKNITYASQYIGNGFSLTINQSITRRNIQSIRPMVAFTKNHKIRHLVHLAGIPKEEGLDNMRIESSLPHERSALKREMDFWAGDCQGFRDYTKIAFSFFENPLTYGTTCPMLRSSVYVNPKGDLYACFHRTDLHLGSIYSNDIAQVFKQIEVQDGLDTSCATLGCACMLEFENNQL